MRREELISKGYSEEQATELLNLFHNENNEIKENNSKLQKDLQAANEKLSEYNKQQKALEEQRKAQMSEQEKFEAMKKEMEEHLANSKLIESKSKAKVVFAEIGGVDDEILNCFVTTDIDKTEENAKAILKFIKNKEEETIKKTKESLLNNNPTPKTPSNTKPEGGTSLTKEEFEKLPITEKNKIFRENKELWDKMTQ